MKKLIIALMTLITTQVALAQSLPWPDGMKCGRHIGVNIDGKFLDSYTQYNWYAVAWREVVQMMGEHMKNPNLKLSFEYLQYRAGYKIMANVDYAADCDQFEELDSEVLALKELQKTRKLTKEDFKGSRWIHMINGIDTEETNCLALSKKDGKYAGCGDVWQDGISMDEAVCIGDKTYLRCHIDCINKIYNRTVEVKPGFCE